MSPSSWARTSTIITACAVPASALLWNQSPIQQNAPRATSNPATIRNATHADLDRSRRDLSHLASTGPFYYARE